MKSHIVVKLVIGSVLLGWLQSATAAKDRWDLSAYENLSRKVCKGIQNSYECSQAIEKQQLAAHRAHAVREGMQLRLQLEGGKRLVLSDITSDVPSHQIRYFSYLDFIPDIGYFLLQVHHYEGGSFLLVSKKSGSRISIDTFPKISPSKQKLATFILCDAYCIPRIRIWSVNTDGMSLECTILPNDYWWGGHIRWVGSDAIDLTYKIPDVSTGVDSPANQKLKTITGRIVWKNSKWNLPKQIDNAVTTEGCSSKKPARKMGQ